MIKRRKIINRRKILKNLVSTIFTVTTFLGISMIAFVAYPYFRDYWNQSGILNYKYGNYSRENTVGVRQRYVVIGDKSIRIETAVTRQERETGLSGRLSLEKGSGMLFIFDNDGPQPIWMKDMNFSIDIMWIDVNKKVVHIEENVSPDTFPRAFSSTVNARYVLEVPAGSVQEYGIKITDQVDFF